MPKRKAIMALTGQAPPGRFVPDPLNIAYFLSRSEVDDGPVQVLKAVVGTQRPPSPNAPPLSADGWYFAALEMVTLLSDPARRGEADRIRLAIRPYLPGLRSKTERIMGWEFKPWDVRVGHDRTAEAELAGVSLLAALWNRMLARAEVRDADLGISSATWTPRLLKVIPAMHTRDLCLAELTLRVLEP
jgi:hypothetical protein